jgi:glycosyltransferase involved in cell wall biosynthesis
MPVIVSNQPGFVEEVIDGLNGFIFNTSDVDSLAETLIRVLSKHNEYESMRANMSKLIQQKYSIENIGERYDFMFKEVLQCL